MKKKWLVTLLTLVALSALAVSGAAAADAITTDSTYPCEGCGGLAGRMRGGVVGERGTGLLHDYIVAAAADKLDLDVSVVEEALTGGTTLYQLAVDNGIVAEDVPAFLQEVHETALDQAVSDGVISEEQAEIMKEHTLRRGTGIGAGGIGKGRYGGMGNGSCLQVTTTP